MKAKMKAKKELVLYYAPEKSDLDRVIKSVFVRKGVRIRNIDDAQTGRTVGFLAGVPGIPEEPEEAEVATDAESAAADGPVSETGKEGLPERMLVFCGFGRGKLNDVLKELRRLNVPQEIMKAALTMNNAGWSFERLYRELSAERDMMNKNEEP